MVKFTPYRYVCQKGSSVSVSINVTYWYWHIIEWQVAAQEAEDKTAEMTKAVDELKKLLKQATNGEIF